MQKSSVVCSAQRDSLPAYRPLGTGLMVQNDGERDKTWQRSAGECDIIRSCSAEATFVSQRATTNAD